MTISINSNTRSATIGRKISARHVASLGAAVLALSALVTFAGLHDSGKAVEGTAPRAGISLEFAPPLAGSVFYLVDSPDQAANANALVEELRRESWLAGGTISTSFDVLMAATPDQDRQANELINQAYASRSEGEAGGIRVIDLRAR